MVGFVVWNLQGPTISTDVEPGIEADVLTPEMLGESEHFQGLGPPGYLSPSEVDEFLADAEDKRSRLLQFLETVENDPPMITLHLHPYFDKNHPIGTTDGLSRIDLWGVKSGRNALVHELTHLMMTVRRALLSEGLAVVAERRFVNQISLPGNEWLYAWCREGNEFIPLTALHASFDLLMPNLQLTMLQYVEAGSFTEYLIDRFDMEPFREVYKYGDFEQVYGISLEQLERDWRTVLERGHLLQGTAFALGGFGILGMLTLILWPNWRWIPATLVGGLVYTLMCETYVYPVILPAVVFTAAAIAGIFGIRSRRLRLATFWALGGIGLVLFVSGAVHPRFFPL